MDVLLLNADARPVSYMPLSTITWQEAITYLFQDKIVVLEYYDRVVSSANWSTKVPSVVMLKKMFRRASMAKFSRQNVFLRDLNQCQYCGEKFLRSDLTLDHVYPQSLGGKTTWDNIVASCQPCNTWKGNKTNIRPINLPRQPSYFDLVKNRKKLRLELQDRRWERYV